MVGKRGLEPLREAGLNRHALPFAMIPQPEINCHDHAPPIRDNLCPTEGELGLLGLSLVRLAKWNPIRDSNPVFEIEKLKT
jgi:hypothetical protein